MTDKEKIIQYIDYKRISKTKFYEKTGLSNGFLDSGSSLNLANLKIILDNYRDLNIDWLLFGKGEMLKNKGTQEKTEVSDKSNSQQKIIELLEQNNEDLRQTIKAQEVTIAQLSGYNEDLKNEIEVLKKEIAGLQKYAPAKNPVFASGPKLSTA